MIQIDQCNKQDRVIASLLALLCSMLFQNKLYWYKLKCITGVGRNYTILINKNSKFSSKDIRRLANHSLGIRKNKST